MKKDITGILECSQVITFSEGLRNQFMIILICNLSPLLNYHAADTEDVESLTAEVKMLSLDSTSNTSETGKLSTLLNLITD